MGDEAFNAIRGGYAREVTQDEAIAILKRNCEEGFILQSCHNEETETICSCHGRCCGIINAWRALGGAADIANTLAFEHISHYTLEVNTDTCAKCGVCANRCPLECITMDEETGLPVVNEMCFKCGQCAYVCPTESRKLVQRPAEEIADLPRGFIEDNNMKAAWRFEHGVIF